MSGLLTSAADPAATGGRFTGCGCLYVAFGFEYLMLAAHSARTLKRHNPGLATLIITNVPVKPLLADGRPLFDKVIERNEESELNRSFKLAVDKHSPFDKTLYLDCDTEVRGDLAPVFRLLDDRDIAVRLLNRVSNTAFDVYPGISAGALGLAEWNSGVIFFRKSDAAVSMFRKWREIFQDEGMARDQPALMRAVLATPELRLMPLGPMWNAKATVLHEYHQLQREPASIRIFHYREPLRRPEIAKAVYRTYRDINPVLAVAERAGGRAPDQWLAEEARFRLLYATYARFLAPLDNRVGRWFLRDNFPRVRRVLRRWLLIRASLLGERAIAPARDRRLTGKKFAQRQHDQ